MCYTLSSIPKSPHLPPKFVFFFPLVHSHLSPDRFLYNRKPWPTPPTLPRIWPPSWPGSSQLHDRAHLVFTAFTPHFCLAHKRYVRNGWTLLAPSQNAYMKALTTSTSKCDLDLRMNRCTHVILVMLKQAPNPTWLVLTAAEYQREH